jgi:hypothetical protein
MAPAGAVAGKRNTAKVAAAAPPRAPGKAPNRAPAKVVTPVAGKRNTASPTYRAPAKAAAPAPAPVAGRSGGGFSGATAASGDFSGGGGAGFSGGFEMAAEPVTQDITIPDPLQSEPYKRAKAEMMRARGDFDSQQNLAKAQYGATFDDTQRQMGWRVKVGEGGPGFDPNAQGTAYGDSYSANQNDFAGRGMFNSGQYLQALSNMNGSFNDRRNSTLRDQKDWTDTQNLNQRNFYGQQDAADLASQEDAISAIMAQLGVGRDQVTPGRQNVIQRPV